MTIEIPSETINQYVTGGAAAVCVAILVGAYCAVGTLFLAFVIVDNDGLREVVDVDSTGSKSLYACLLLSWPLIALVVLCWVVGQLALWLPLKLLTPFFHIHNELVAPLNATARAKKNDQPIANP